MRKKNKSRNNFLINKLLLVCFFVMLVFSIFNIGKVVAAVDNIAITNAIIKDKTTTTDASVISFDRNKIVTEVTFHKVNDYVTFELTLKNNDSKKYTIKTISDNNSDSHIVYEYDKHENEEFNSGEEKKFIIKSTYKNEVLNVNNREVQDDVEFKITFVDEDGEESDKVIPINPQTNDKIIIYGILAIISLAGLLITLKSRKVKNSLLVLLLMIPFATKAASLSYQFDFKTDIDYFDKMVVTVDRNGTKEQIIVPYGEKMSAPEVVTIPGYNFIGYYDGDNEVDFNSNITEDTNITAKYEAIIYNISYDLDDGTVATANPLTFTVEDEFTLNNPTKQGFEFAGWTGTGLDGLTTSVKINKGTTEDLSFTANYTAGTSTPYKVIHKYQNYDLTTYTDEEQSLTGVTGTTVYPQIRHKDGFIDPTVTGVMIKADGTAKLEYTYQRDSFTYSFDSNVTSSKEAGTYLFETEITVSPKEVQGYTFGNWEDGSTDNPRTISLSGNTNVVPTYVPRDDTQYTIHHCYKNLNDGCDTTDVVGHGTTGQTIEAPRVPKTGFVTPDAANITILADGTAELTYTYNRETYTFAVGENITSTKVNGTYPYGTEITVTATPAAGYTFVKWEDNSTTNPRTITLTDDISVSATFTANDDTEYTVHHRYQQLDNTYNTVDVTETGTTDTTVTAPLRSQTGYVDPTTEQVTIFGDGSAEVTYTYDRETYTFAIGDHVTSTLAPGTYMYGTTITVTADTRQGYTFTEWENGITTASRVIVLTSDITAVATYSNNTDTPYTVNHYKQQLDGTYPSVADDTDSLTGTTEASVTPTTNTYTGFTSPATQTKQIMGDGTTTFTYNYTRNKYNLILTNTDYIQEGDISDEYYYEEEIELHALPKTGYTFAGWSDGENIIENSTTITISMGTEDVTVGPTYTINSYTITFETQGGTPQPSSRVITYGNQIGALPDDVEKDGYTFAGWYDDPDNGTQITATTVIDGTTTIYYAHWDEIVIPSIICKKALSLNTAQCNASSGGCRAGNKYASGETIYYGNIIRSDIYTAGDAFDCNVDGTGYNQRFYYLRTVDNKAVLISNNNFEGTAGQQNDHNFEYDVALTKLPTTTQWNNLPVTYGNYAARFVTWDDLAAAAGRNDLTTANSLKDLPFLFENIGKYATTAGRSTVWLEAVDDGGTLQGYRYHISNVAVQTGAISGSKPSLNCVRPVIEVPLVSIEDDYVIKFDAMGGTLANEYIRVAKGSEIGTLPTPTKSNLVFDGWYTTDQFTTQISSSTIPTEYSTYYANYKLTAADAIYATYTYKLSEGTTSQIVILNSEAVEPVTYTSNDTSIATVDSNGLVTGVAEGNTTITVEGTISHTHQTVNIEVSEDTPQVHITFDTHGGTDVAAIDIDINTSIEDAIGAMPTTTKDDNTFIGWFNNASYDVEIKGDNEILADITLHALWMPNDTVASINGKYFYSSLQTAIDEGVTTDSKTTIKVLQDITLASYLNLETKNTSRNIVLDLDGHTITSTSTQTIKTKAALLEIKNGTVRNTSANGTIDIGSGGHLILEDNITVVNTGERAAVYNNGGIVE